MVEERIFSRSGRISAEQRMAFALARYDSFSQEQAHRDPLTRVYHAEYFRKRFTHELRKANHCEKDLSVLVMNLDNLHDSRSLFGPRFTGKALAAAATAILESIRPGDAAARLGEEEFVVLFPETEIEGACVAAERIRARIARKSLHLLNTELRASAGVSHFPSHAMTEEGLLNAAKRALYMAKKNGENQTAVFNPDPGAKPKVLLFYL
ncbi:MAG: GGDEF domain-containing protein [Armatimonadetes bacterium]|nr:GGDEF domain-containing protein [Armatimonadota bacterium]